jgi:hypothetical protein
MTLSTDDLRLALADAAEAPYDAAGVARMRGVRARVLRERRRRAAAAGGVGTLAVLAVVGATVLGGGRTASAPPASSTTGPTATSRTVQPVDLPAFWGVRDVVAPLSGSGAEAPARLVTWPEQVTGLVVRCDGEGGSVAVSLEPSSGERSGTSFTCDGANQSFQVGDLPAAAARIRAGEQVRVQVRLEPSGEASAVGFGAGLLVGRDLIDLSTLPGTPKGYTSVGAYAMADGWQYTSDVADGAAQGEPVTDGVQIALADRRAVHLQVRCSGGVRLDVDPGDAGEATSVTCPPGIRSTRTLDVDLRPSRDQRLTLRAADAMPGALVEVGVSTR